MNARYNYNYSSPSIVLSISLLKIICVVYLPDLKAACSFSNFNSKYRWFLRIKKYQDV